MVTLTTRKTVETQKSFSEGSSAREDLPGAGPTTQVGRRGRPAVSTIKEPAVIRIQKTQVLPETRAGFLTRTVRGLKDLAFRMGVGSPGIAHYRDSQVLTVRERTELDAAYKGWFHY